MSMDEDDKSPGELGKERQVMLMNPASSVVEPARKFFPFGKYCRSFFVRFPCLMNDKLDFVGCVYSILL